MKKHIIDTLVSDRPLSEYGITLLLDDNLPGIDFRNRLIMINDIPLSGEPVELPGAVYPTPGMIYYTPPHIHGNIEFLYIISGHAIVSVGREQIECFGGEVIFVNPYEQHSICYDLSAGLKRMVLSILPVSDIFADFYRYVSQLSHERKAIAHRFVPGLNAELSSLFREIIASAAPMEQWSEYAIIGRSLCILSRLMGREELVRDNEVENLSNDFMKQVCEYLSRHLTSDISLADIAADMKYSRTHFCHLFKETFGMPFHKYLNKMRINQAKRAICREPDISITLLAAELGYNDPNYFTRVFGRIVGMSPREYASLEKSKRAANGILAQ